MTSRTVIVTGGIGQALVRAFVAAHWDPTLPIAEAAAPAGAPAAWPDLAQSPVWPGGKPAS